MALFITDSLNRMPMPAREIPDITRPEVRNFGSTFRIYHCHSAMSLDYICPLCGVRVPMQLAQTARFQIHVHTRDAPGHRKVGNTSLFGCAPFVHALLLLVQFKL